MLKKTKRRIIHPHQRGRRGKRAPLMVHTRHRWRRDVGLRRVSRSFKVAGAFRRLRLQPPPPPLNAMCSLKHHEGRKGLQAMSGKQAEMYPASGRAAVHPLRPQTAPLQSRILLHSPAGPNLAATAIVSTSAIGGYITGKPSAGSRAAIPSCNPRLGRCIHYTLTRQTTLAFPRALDSAGSPG